MARGFGNPVVGGVGNLIRSWIQSVPFVSGSTGWRISKNGNAEFNNAIFRGTVTITSGNDLLVYSTAAPALNKLIVAIAGSAGNDGLGNSWLAGINLYDSAGVQIGVWSTAGFKLINDVGGGFVLVSPNNGTLRSPSFSFSGNVAGLSSVNADIHSNVNGIFPNQYEGMFIGSPKTTADTGGSTADILILGAAPPANNSASGLFQWANTATGVITLGQWDNNGFHIYRGDITAVQPGTSSPPIAESWHSPALNAGFANHGGTNAVVSYQKEGVNGGRVRLGGQFDCTANHAANTILFTLPAGYVPGFSQQFIVPNGLSGSAGQNSVIAVNTSGQVVIVPASTNGNSCILDGIVIELD
jgi:hypothetical protein